MASLQLDDKTLPQAEAQDIKHATVVIEATDDNGNSSSEDRQVATEDWTYPHPTSFTISEHPIDEFRELKVRI